ncbi:molecular chaperone DnaJ [Apiospora arundinis]
MHPSLSAYPIPTLAFLEPPHVGCTKAAQPRMTSMHGTANVLTLGGKLTDKRLTTLDPPTHACSLRLQSRMLACPEQYPEQHQARSAITSSSLGSMSQVAAVALFPPLHSVPLSVDLSAARFEQRWKTCQRAGPHPNGDEGEPES